MKRGNIILSDHTLGEKKLYLHKRFAHKVLHQAIFQQKLVGDWKMKLGKKAYFTVDSGDRFEKGESGDNLVVCVRVCQLECYIWRFLLSFLNIK